MAPRYDSKFMSYAAQSSAHSAAVVTAHLAPLLRPASVLDVGCASGTWLRAWGGQGISDIAGIDGDYVDRSRLEIPAERFAANDLASGFNLGREFDLVQSLEVGEHITPAASQIFIDSIARHASRFILFSAAPPGQGGEHHVNERPYEYWRQAFARHGFAAIDAVRPIIAGDKRISYWYRYNVFLYARLQLLDQLDSRLREHIVPDHSSLADVSPLAFRVRKTIVRALPASVQNGVARFKSRVSPTGRI